MLRYSSLSMISRLSFLFLTACAFAAAAIFPASGKEPAATRDSHGVPTFNRDVAPIIFENCVVCHHPGGIGPFSLADFREVKKRAKTIAKVTTSRFMPPWLPEHGVVEFEGERRLSDEQIATIEGWWKAGAPEGVKADLKAKPVWNDDWQLGKPDLVVTMPVPYTLPAEGKDVYRSFILPDVVPADRYVVGMEIRPGNPRAVHHAFLLIDRRGGSRRLAQKEIEPGFPGMTAGPDAEMPAGTFAGWQPGRMAERQPADLAWVLPKNADIVLKMHMRPTGKPEKVQASVGLYFTDRPPVRQAFSMCLRSVVLDIPAGTEEFPIEESYTLPVEGDVLAVLPHLHYLGREVHGWAELPDGSRRELLLIRHWDFDWQGAYRYTAPVALPKGATVHMRFTYDNTAANPRNPNHPPQRVRYGPQSSDEMGEFWLQFLPRREADLPVLQRDFITKCAIPDELARTRAMLGLNPRDAVSRAELAAALVKAGQLDDAAREARQALSDDPASARAHYILGSIAARQNQLAPALAEFAAAVAADPDDADAQNNLGFLLLLDGKPDEAIPHLEKAIALHPDDALARQNLEKAREALKK